MVLPVFVPMLMFVMLMFVMLMFVMLMAVLDLLRMTAMLVMMLFVYHSSVHFPSAKVRRSGCNRVAIVAGIG